jgi:hypothetical protein
MIKEDNFTNRKKIVSDLIRFNFNKNNLNHKNVDIDDDFICLLPGVHKRLLHLFVQNKTIDEMSKDKTLIKYVYRQFAHYKYYHNRVLNTLKNKELLVNELNCIFKYVKDYIEEYNNALRRLKNEFKRNSTIVKYLSHDYHYIPDTKLVTLYYNKREHYNDQFSSYL